MEVRHNAKVEYKGATQNYKNTVAYVWEACIQSKLRFVKLEGKPLPRCLSF